MLMWERASMVQESAGLLLHECLILLNEVRDCCSGSYIGVGGAGYWSSVKEWLQVADLMWS